jgi:hypothetical protein
MDEFPPHRTGSGDMDQVFIDLFFPDPDRLGDLFGRNRLLFQDKNNGLPESAQGCFFRFFLFSKS